MCSNDFNEFLFFYIYFKKIVESLIRPKVNVIMKIFLNNLNNKPLRQSLYIG